MKIFIDTLDLKEIKKYADLGILSGVTTNSTFAKKFGMSSELQMLKKVRKALGKGEIHVSIHGKNEEVIFKNALNIFKKSKDKNLVFKIAIGEQGIIAVKKLLAKKLKTNLHLIYSLNQALIAGAIGSTYICPLVGRLDDIGDDALRNVKNIKDSYELNNEKTVIMVSSVRHPMHVLKSYEIGVEAITIPPAVLEKMFYHPLTEIGVKKFEKDYRYIKKPHRK
jgi:transaldolase